jgi:hypothetical protein
MKSFLRYFGAVVFLILAVSSFGLFEYWKLLEADSRYLGAGVASIVALYLSIILFLPTWRLTLRERMTWSTTIVILLSMAEGGFLKWKSESDLNKLLHARGRCESSLVSLVGNRFDGSLETAQNVCTLRILHDSLATTASGTGEEELLSVAKLLRYEGRLDETAFVLILSFYATLESKRADHSETSALDVLKNEFNFVEGSVPFFDIYQVREFFDGTVGITMERNRMKKLIELSTLGKTLGVFISRTRGATEGYQDLLKGSMKLESGELTLLGLRSQRLKDSYNRIVSNWKLLETLESLNLKDTYPEQYQKVLREVTYEPL